MNDLPYESSTYLYSYCNVQALRLMLHNTKFLCSAMIFFKYDVQKDPDGP
uniref:Uncharacterized protein n=1 Tax=Anguilla anguilla TaxID=7936 RepID=A0A0E9V7D3_ANGAN